MNDLLQRRFIQCFDTVTTLLPLYLTFFENFVVIGYRKYPFICQYFDYSSIPANVTDSEIQQSLMNNIDWFVTHRKCYRYYLARDTLAYKKVRCYNTVTGQLSYEVVTLMVPEGATVVESLVGDGKCRTNCAITQSYANDKRGCLEITSFHDPSYHYPITVGKLVLPRYRFDDNDNVCGSGIHFFWSYREALMF